MGTKAQEEYDGLTTGRLKWGRSGTGARKKEHANKKRGSRGTGTYAASVAAAAVAVSAVVVAAVTGIHFGGMEKLSKTTRRFHCAFVDVLFDVLESSVFWRCWVGEEEG
jgi:hypothetical protein